MATLRSSIQIYDGMTGPLRSMHKVMSIVINSFESMQTLSAKAIDTTSLHSAMDELADIGATMTQWEEQIKRANQQQQQFNSSIQSGHGVADGLMNKLKGIAATVGAGIGVSKIVGLSDNLAQSEARLSLIVDDGGSVEALQQKIFASAQAARGSYLDTVQNASKLGLLAGNAFTGNNEIIRFTELMNKNFAIGGASIQEQTSAMYQLTQAMAAGKLQGDEYRSIIENAPLLANSIEEYMRNSGIEGTMKDWASDGLLTAGVIKNALFSSAEEIDARFASMPLTWGQIFTTFKNEAIMAFQPVLTKINEIANNEQFQNFYKDIIGGLYAIGSMAVWAFDVMASMGSGIYENWSWMSPLIWGVVGAMVAYHGTIIAINTVLGIKNALDAISIARSAMKAGATLAEAAATTTATGAQVGLNMALLACPITWIIIGIIALIAIIYAVVAAVNHFAGTSISATGAICGIVMVAAAFIGNLIIGLLNAMIQYVWTIFVEPFLGIIEFILNATNGGFNSFGDAVANLIGQIISWFLSLGKVVTKIIDAIFGTDWTSGLSSLQNSVLAWGKNENAITLDRSAPTINHRFEYGAAWDMGYKFGEGIDKKIGGMFNGDAFGLGAYDNMSDITSGVQNIDSNTGAMRDALDITEEELKYLRDLAEQEAINRYTTASLKVEMTNHNNINSNLDLDGIVDDLTDGVSEVVNAAAEGVHS